MVVSDGFLLGGRVRYRQPVQGFRSGLEPVLLAASVPAKPGELVLEAGTGAGAALLCLAERVPGVCATGVEIDADVADLAAANAAANGMQGITVLTGSIEAAALPFRFDHAIANPPYHPAASTASPQAARDTAKRGSAPLAEAWIARLATLLRYHGTMTLIVSTWLVPACLAAMERHDCACSVVFPLWPKQGVAAKLAILRGIRSGRSPLRLCSGLVLHNADGSFTESANRVLRDAAALDLSG